MNYAEEIKERVTAKELFQFYGFEINRAGFCRSPFAANDKTPSLKIYDGDRGWHDFSSGIGGDVIDFVQKYFGLSFVDAQTKIDQDFRLGLGIGEPLTRERQIELDRKAAERRQKIAEKKQAHNDLMTVYYDALEHWIYLDKMIRENEPKNEKELLAYDEKMEKWIYAAKNLPYASYLMEEAEYKLHEFEYAQKHSGNNCNGETEGG